MLGRVGSILFPCHRTASRFTREFCPIRSGKDSRLSAHDLLLFLPEFRILVIFGLHAGPPETPRKVRASKPHKPPYVRPAWEWQGVSAGALRVDCVPASQGAQMGLEHLLGGLTVATVLDDDRRPASRDCGDQVRAPLGRLSTQDLGSELRRMGERRSSSNGLDLRPATLRNSRSLRHNAVAHCYYDWSVLADIAFATLASSVNGVCHMGDQVIALARF